ncbi:MAG: hypothetical protein WBZ29_01220, partial [Methanocella sp.]
DGNVYMWGCDNHMSAAGMTMDAVLQKPKKIAIDNIASISVSDYVILALKKDGTLWAWGNNQHGQIGDGTFTKDIPYGKYVPVRVLIDTGTYPQPTATPTVPPTTSVSATETIIQSPSVQASTATPTQLPAPASGFDVPTIIMLIGLALTGNYVCLKIRK